jgi:hypothetical protein
MTGFSISMELTGTPIHHLLTLPLLLFEGETFLRHD